jgi:hypothetical protein
MAVAFNPATIDFSALAGIGQNIGGALGQHNLGTAMRDSGAIGADGTLDYNKMVAVLAERRPELAAKMAVAQQEAANRYGHNLVFDEHGRAYQTMSGGGLSPVQGEGGAKLTAPQKYIETPDGWVPAPSRGPMGGHNVNSVPTVEVLPDGTTRPTQPQSESGVVPSLGSQKYKDERGDKAKKEEKQGAAKSLSSGIVGMEIGRARKAIAGKPFLPNTGFVGGITQNVPGTPAHDLQGILAGIKSNLGFDKLQAMREASPTGGALGPVSDYENRTLQSVLGDIEQSRTSEQLDFNLRRLDFIYDKVVNQGLRDGENPFAGFDQEGGGERDTAADPLGMR